MKTITIYIAMALLCLNIQVKAQDNKAVDVTLKGIQIGQKVPDITITGLHNYKDASGKPATTAKLSDFKGKLLILDFWATWCSPCIAMIPKMDSLQKVFGDKVAFLSVTYQSEKEVLPFLEKFGAQQKKRFDLPVVTDSKELHNLFPHTTLPHYVWIDGNGVVKAITGFEEVNTEDINKVIASAIELGQKKDMKIAFDNKKPFLINGNGGDGSNMIYHSVLTKFTEGMGSGFSRTPYNTYEQGKINLTNTTLLQMFRIAYGGYSIQYGPNRLFIDVIDSNSLKSNKTGKEYLGWLRNGNGFCYELIVPTQLSTQLFEVMRINLNILFPNYKVQPEKKKIKCLVLKRTSAEEKFKSQGGILKNEFSPFGCEMRNSSFSSLTARLEMQFYRNAKYPIVDGTNYKKPIDLKIDGKLSDLITLNAQLLQYDLKFEIDEYITDVLIVTDKQKSTTN